MCPKDAEAIANSVDPDQTAAFIGQRLLRSSLIWVYIVCRDMSVGKLRIITVLADSRVVFLGDLLSSHLLHEIGSK